MSLLLLGSSSEALGVESFYVVDFVALFFVVGCFSYLFSGVYLQVVDLVSRSFGVVFFVSLPLCDHYGVSS